MNTTSKILILTMMISTNVACVSVDTDIDDAANTLADSMQEFEDNLDDILRGQAEAGSDDEYTEADQETEDATGAVYVATYHQVANTCAATYDLDEYLKLFSDVSEDGLLGQDTFFKDLGGETMDVTIDGESGLMSFTTTGTSVLDRLTCDCEIDSVGFTCHCGNLDDDTCATVYDIQ